MQKILAIDDEQNYLAIIKIFLNDLLPDTLVFTAQSGREGLEIAQQEPPDVILLDIIMPGMNGYMVCSKLKVQEATKHIPIIMLTAITESEHRIKALDSGADVFLTKPIDKAELIAQINVMLRIKRAEDKLRQEKNILEELVAERTTELQKEIAERKWIEEMLRKNENRFRTISELVSDYAYVARVEPDGRLTLEWITDAFTRITGYTLKEVNELGDWMHLIHPEDKDIAIRHKQTLLSGSESIVEYRIITKTNDVFWLRNYIRPVGDEALGCVVSLFGAAQNITERKRAEKALEKAKEAAETASRTKSEFLANMSHELRTPLNAILGYAQILKNANNLTEHQQEGLETIKNSGEHLLNMINEILDFSKIEAGCTELQVSKFHFPEFLKHIVEMIRIRAKQKGISFVYKRDLDLPVGVQADEKKLRQVLFNLLGNAIKFTEEGGVTFKVEVRSNRFSDLPTLPPSQADNDLTGITHPSPSQEGMGSAEVPTANIHFQVEDTGIGVVSEKLQEIFLPFQQVGEQRHAVEGTGLGLAISHRLVEMMDGELHVKSTVGKGSVFWFDLNLPVVEGVIPSATKPSRKILGYKGEQRTVLIVDDNPANRAVLVGVLLSLGFNILEAENGQECVEKTINIKPDIIFLDLRMPVLDGFGATQQIRNTEGTRDIVIIAVSASVFEETRKRALAIGFDDFLIKPFQFENLLDLLQTHLRLEWIYEEEPEERPEIAFPLYSESQTISLPPGELEILLALASKSRIKPLLQHLSKIEALDETFRPFVEELRQLARDYQSKEIVKRLQQIKERKFRQDPRD